MKLLGTIHHFDLEGTRRLEHYLNSTEPKKITVESPVNLSLEEVEGTILINRNRKIQLVRELKIPDIFKQFYLEFFSNKYSWSYEFRFL